MDICRLNNAVIKRVRRSLNLYPQKSNDSVCWGIIGLGNMAQVFADALNLYPEAKLTAVASRSEEKAKVFASRNHVPASYGSYEAMLSDKALHLDVVYIATPVKHHYSHIKLCLEAGKNVLCEKPITFNASQLEELMTLAKDKGCFLMEGMWMKCLPSFRQAFSWLTDGKIGRLKLIRVNLFKREIIRPERNIYNASEGGGVLRDYGVYALAFVQAFLTHPSLSSVSSLISAFDLDSDWQILLEQDGVKSFINLSSNFASNSKAALIGEEGVIEFESQFNRTNSLSLYSKNGCLVETRSFQYKSDGFEYEIEHVGKMIRERNLQSSLCPLEDSLEVAKLIDSLLSDE